MVIPLPIRAAGASDAEHMCRIINEIMAVGGTTSHTEPFDSDRMRATFISPPRGVSCFVVCTDVRVAGFQALEWSDPDWPGDDRLPDDWAFISTFVQRDQHSKGLGSALFRHTLLAAKAARVRFIDATIRRENHGGLAFYDKLGFQDYRRDEHTISKRRAV
jgi:ribosomal protein S18 acetylase RimI-like enzyme